MDEISGQQIHGIVLTRLDRVQRGSFGDWKPVGEGAFELRFDVGPGHRVYYGLDGDTVVLLCAGRKNKQSKLIAAAIKYWKDYNA